MIAYAILGCIAGFIVLERVTKPYRLRAVDGVRSVFKIQFPNAAYTALIARKMANPTAIIEPLLTSLIVPPSHRC